LWKKKFNGIINVASGNKFYLKNIAIKMAKKKNKKLFFLKNNEETALIANISKLKKLGWKPKYKNSFSGIF
jgi:nucleoside-diphosphate-sugar epimerase